MNDSCKTCGNCIVTTLSRDRGYVECEEQMFPKQYREGACHTRIVINQVARDHNDCSEYRKRKVTQLKGL